MKYRRCFAEIDLDAILSNIEEVRKKVGDAKILAVLKANGYGHGSLRIAKLIKDKIDYIGVADIDEGIELREEGINLPILVLGYTALSEHEDAINYDITQTIYNLDMAEKLNETAKRLNKKAKIHVAIDTGMTRIGFMNSDDSIRDIVAISKMSNIELEGVFSHFSCADMYDKAYSKKQMETYDWFIEELKAKGVDIPIKHFHNSAGIMEFDSHRFDMVRSGIITYGMYPSDEVNYNSIKIKPALSLKCHVINVKTVDEGIAVGYGATYVTDRKTKVATLSVGYADGYPRSLSNKGRVLINGQYAPIIGRVCMDQIMVDVTHIDDVKIEDIAVLIGKDGDNLLSMEEVSNLAGSFNYELPCVINKRVPRLYKLGGKFENE